MAYATKAVPVFNKCPIWTKYDFLSVHTTELPLLASKYFAS